VAEAVLQLLMEADVEGLIGAARHERSPTDRVRGLKAHERLNDRNGDRERGIETRLGTLSPGIPKRRQGSYFPPFLEPRKTAEKALVSVIREAWSGRVSTRRAGKPVQAMGRNGISKSQVSKLYHRRRARAGVVGIFPNETGIARLIGAVLLEQNDMYGPPRIARMITLR
jgi:putative transposase